MEVLNLAFAFVRGWFVGHASLLAENLALRQQLAVLHRTAPKPRLRWSDRVFWVWLRCLWSGWQDALVLVQPDTVVRWSRDAFRVWWRWKSRGNPGRPKLDGDLRNLIAQMARDNPTWGAPRIQSTEKSNRRSPARSSPNRWSADCITAIGERCSVSTSRSAGFRRSADCPSTHLSGKTPVPRQRLSSPARKTPHSSV